MIDLHTHILPGIDDGSHSIEQSLEMAHLAAMNGTARIVATPHTNRANCLHRRFDNLFSEELLETYRRLRRAISEANIPVEIFLGQEVYATNDIYDKIKGRKVIGLNNSRYLLTEFSFGSTEEIIAKGVAEVRRAGMVPVVAHPERYECVIEDPELVKRLGTFIQVNTTSFLGAFGREVEETAEYLLREGLVTVMASDAHDTVDRAPILFECRRKLEEEYGYDIAKKLLHSNPGKILKNLSL